MAKFAKIFVTLSVVAFLRCHKPCHEPNYTFSVTDTIYPGNDSISIGDTLILGCSFSKNLKSTGIQGLVNFANAANLGTNLIISDINAFTGSRGAVDSFTYFNVFGRIYSDPNLNPQNVKQLSFYESDTTYQLKVGLIPSKKGMYILTIPDIPKVYRKGSVDCGVGYFAILNVNINKHLYLFENKWGALSEYDSVHSYCFTVK
ncbi:MAG TPA: hypothetical protein VNX68_17020 [Nitrosopumilaceae archaeon]|jgi:hypothetical protein|nr:hypothetical protein [Nitrosopumilaceae archaeon]